ncbi:MAG: HAMP domain-containing histidine kinase [Hydrogenibacillus sp.]|nr:HAMP domain-containing histidine kinase [Hydrogenibacillus sp.]
MRTFVELLGDLRRYAVDRWRFFVPAFFGFLSAVLVFVLAGLLDGHPYLLRDALYAFFLAVLFWTIGLIWDAYPRNAFLRLLKAHMTEDVAEAERIDRPPPESAPTRDLETFLAVLRAYDAAWRKKHAETADKVLFYTAFGTRFVHQMKTPISALTLLIEAANRAAADGRLEAMWPEMRRSFEAEVGRMEGLTQQMLNTVRLEDIARDLALERFSLVDAVRDVVNAYKHEWVIRRIYPSFDVAGRSEDYLVHTDRKWLRLIVEQIVKNALQYGRKGMLDEHGPHDEAPDSASATFIVRFRRDRAADLLVVAFVDEGYGMPKEDVSRAFEPFFTGTMGRRVATATGIGLYLAREAAKRIGAHLRLMSEPGAGTTVELIFPRAAYFEPHDRNRATG